MPAARTPCMSAKPVLPAISSCSPTTMRAARSHSAPAQPDCMRDALRRKHSAHTHTNTYQAQSPRGDNAPSASVLTEHIFTITVLANMVPCGLEPQTSRLLAERSSQLSYETRCCANAPSTYILNASDQISLKVCVAMIIQAATVPLVATCHLHHAKCLANSNGGQNAKDYILPSTLHRAGDRTFWNTTL